MTESTRDFDRSRPVLCNMCAPDAVHSVVGVSLTYDLSFVVGYPENVFCTVHCIETCF